ncbi:hypothetical protein H8N01_30150 [Streptomyces sp. AC536]|nr:hypothetical protein [Streptomyces buecherae]QNJ44737.1 hypothetical protein H7H31_31230 [Streptomyces buecherae]
MDADRRAGGADRRQPAEAVLSRPADAEYPNPRVWPAADVLATFRFHADDEVDVNPRELRGQDRRDVFCGFLCEIGRRLGRSNADRDRRLAKPAIVATNEVSSASRRS